MQHNKLVQAFIALTTATLFVFCGFLPSATAHAASFVHTSNHIAAIDASAQQPLTVQQAQAACKKVVTKTTQWWGVQIYFNDCAIQYMIFLEGGGANGLATAIASLCSPCAPISGVLGAVFTSDVGTLGYLDSKCGGQGAYINETWAGVWWDSQVC